MRMGQGVRTGFAHGGNTCVLQTQFSSFIIFVFVHKFYQCMIKKPQILQFLQFWAIIFQHGAKSLTCSVTSHTRLVSKMISMPAQIHFVAPASGMARYRDPVLRSSVRPSVRLSVNICDLASTLLFKSVTMKLYELLRQNLVQI